MVLWHFTHNPTDVLGVSGLLAGPGLTALLRSRLGFRQFHPGDSYPAVQTDPEIQRGQKIRAANVRERSASHWPRCRCRSGFPAPTLPRPLRRWRYGLGCGPQPTLSLRRRISRPRFFAAVIPTACRRYASFLVRATFTRWKPVPGVSTYCAGRRMTKRPSPVCMAA